MRDRALFGTVTALVAIAIIGAGFVSMYPGALQGESSSSSASGATSPTGSILGGSQTVLATLAASTMTSAPGTSATSSSAPTSTTSSSASITSSVSSTSTDGGSYSVTPSSQVEVISVTAIMSQGGGGSVTFSVKAKNIGDGDIYVLRGGGSGLNLTVTSGASLLRQVATPRCEIAAAMAPVSPGSSWTDNVPGCWSGYAYDLVGSGTIGVELQLSWSSGGNPSPGGTYVTIYATFTLQ